MVQETIRSIRETEEQADEIVRQAEQKSREIFEEAEKRAADISEEILREARTEALALEEQAKEEADKIIKEMNREAKQKNQQKALENRAKLKEKLSTVQEDFLRTKKVKATHKPPTDLKAGDRVYVISFDQTGVALTAPDKNKEEMVPVLLKL